MPKYNIALIPISKGNKVIKLASQFSELADQYLLGKDSFPHVTLYRFEAEEKAIEDIWRRVNEGWNEQAIELEFKKFSCVSFDGTIFWTSLLPNNCDELNRMHELIAQILGKPIKEKFDPHMTLFNTRNKDYKKYVEAIKRSYDLISDTFVLSLGHSDDVGQLTKVILKYEGKPRLPCKNHALE